MAVRSGYGGATGDLRPALECPASGKAVLVGSDLIAVREEEVVDAVVGGEETLYLTR